MHRCIITHGECCTLLEIYLISLLSSKTNTAGAHLSSYLLNMGISCHVRKPKQTPGKHHNGTGWTQTDGFHVKYSHFHASCIHPPPPPNTHKHTREPFMCLVFRSQEGMGTVEDWVMQLILLFLLTEGNEQSLFGCLFSSFYFIQWRRKRRTHIHSLWQSVTPF